MKVESFVKENDWARKVRAQVSHPLLSIGWGNGYAVIPREHPCFRMDFGLIHEMFHINIHGGLTHSSYGKEFFGHFHKWGSEDYWVVGFDTCHFGDGKWTKEMVEEEASRLAFQFFEIWLKEERRKNA